MLVFVYMADDNIPPQTPRRFPKAKISRWQFIVLNIALLFIFGGSFLFLLFENPINYILIAIIVLVWMVLRYILRILRLNDISADTQNKLWTSGNMFFAQGWLPWFAPSSSSPDGSLNDVSMSTGDRDSRMKLIGRNFLRYFIVWAILLLIIVALSNFLLTRNSSVNQNQNNSTTTPSVVLSLGANESTTLSMVVPPGFEMAGGAGGGAIFPVPAANTPTVNFSSLPLSQVNFNNAVQQTLDNSVDNLYETQNSHLPVSTASTTFLGYPAQIITAQNDKSAKTIVFQIGSSTNMIEIAIIYATPDINSENEKIDGIINSIEISNNSSTNISTASDLTIQEWGVQFQKPAGMDDLEYAITANDIIKFSTQQLQNLNQDCAPATGAIGALSRSKNGTLDGDFSTSTSAPIGGYYYYFTIPNGPCSLNSQALSLEGEQSKLLMSTVLSTLQTITSTALVSKPYIIPSLTLITSGADPTKAFVVVIGSGFGNSPTILINGNGYPGIIITPESVETWTSTTTRVEFPLPSNIINSTSTYSIEVINNGVVSNAVDITPVPLGQG
jgi:hypothetical protein